MEKIMVKKNKSGFFVWLPILAALFVVINFLVGIKIAAAAETCTAWQSENDHSFTYTVSPNGTASVQNTADCDMPMTLVAYKMYDESLAGQTIYSHQSDIISAHSSATLNVSLPGCKSQIDLYYGLSVLPATAQEVDYALVGGDYCTDTVPTYTPAPAYIPAPAPTPALTGSCSVSPSSVDAGGYLDWYASASGGTGLYTYSWTGTDGLYGNSSYVSKPYFSAGPQTGTVTITSGGQSITANCSAVVNEVSSNNNYNYSYNNFSNLYVTCYASQHKSDG